MPQYPLGNGLQAFPLIHNIFLRHPHADEESRETQDVSLISLNFKHTGPQGVIVGDNNSHEKSLRFLKL